MLGNWSFGDYFFQESIDWCYNLLIDTYGMDKTRLCVTYFGGDEKTGLQPDLATRDYWLKYFPKERIFAYAASSHRF
jgi:alanyl-tRNA synthetase